MAMPTSNGVNDVDQTAVCYLLKLSPEGQERILDE
jgi:hypothetical protein